MCPNYEPQVYMYSSLRVIKCAIQPKYVFLCQTLHQWLVSLDFIQLISKVQFLIAVGS